MARVLVIHLDRPQYKIATFASHLYSYRRYSSHECLYFCVNRSRVPRYIQSFDPDLVVFQNTLTASKGEPEFDAICNLIAFVKNLSARKAYIAADESYQTEALREFIREFGVTHVFTFASPDAQKLIYGDLIDSGVRFIPALAGYVDYDVVDRVARLARQSPERSIDIGARLFFQPIGGRIALRKILIARALKERATAYGLTTDISHSPADMLLGDAWFSFLLRCRYTIGAETGSSLLDTDGRILRRISTFMSEHSSATFEEIEAHCFPGLDGQLDYRALAPRHLEAIITRTCQVLVEGDYSGVLQPGLHYIELKRDFSNIDQVLATMQDENLREKIVERAYTDIVESHAYDYQSFVNLVFSETLGGPRTDCPKTLRQSLRGWLNRLGEAVAMGIDSMRPLVRPLLSRVLGEPMLRRILAHARRPRVD